MAAIHSLAAQTKTSIDSISTHMGDSVQICLKVYGIKSTEKITYINLGAAFPNAPVTVVILAKDSANFNNTHPELLTDQEVCITGKLTEYKGKPQIVVTKSG